MRRALVILAAVLFAVAPGARGGAMDLVQPVPGSITRHFEAPPTPYAAGHRGIDFGAAVGTPVVAAAGGIVSFAGQVGGSLFVSIDHDGGLRTTYSFLSAILVKKSQAVAQGQQIARSGPGAAGGKAHPPFAGRSSTGHPHPKPYPLAPLRRNPLGAR